MIFSKAESMVVDLLVRYGESNKEIAKRLNVKKDTVAKHMRNIVRKLKVSNRTQIVLAVLKEKHDSRYR